MGSTLILWWSLLWRMTLAVFAISYPTALLVNALGADTPDWIVMRTSLAWLLFAVVFWCLGSFATKFFEAVLSGTKLGLTHRDWRMLGRAVAVLFALLAVLNRVVASSVTEESWVTFKVAAPFPLLMLVLLVFAARARRAAA